MKKIIATESNYSDGPWNIGAMKSLANVIVSCFMIYVMYMVLRPNQETETTELANSNNDVSIAFNTVSQFFITNMMICGLLLKNRQFPNSLGCTGLLSVNGINAKKIDSPVWWNTLDCYGQLHAEYVKLEKYGDGAIMHYEEGSLDRSLTSLRETVDSDSDGVHILCLEGVGPHIGKVLVRVYNPEFLDIVNAVYICDYSRVKKGVVRDEISQQQEILGKLTAIDHNDLKTPEIHQFEQTMNWGSPTDLETYLRMTKKVMNVLKKYEKKLKKSAERIVSDQEKRDALPPTIKERVLQDIEVSPTGPIHLHVFRGIDHFKERPKPFPDAPLAKKCDVINRSASEGETVFEKVLRLMRMSQNSIDAIEGLLSSSSRRDEF